MIQIEEINLTPILIKMGLIEILTIIITIVKYGWPFAILAWLVASKIMWKNWPVEVVIIEKRGDNLIKSKDRAGRYLDNFSGLTGYKLLKAGDTIPVIDFNWILHNADKPTNILEKLVKILRPDIGTLFLYKYGSKQYKPLKPIHDKQAPMEWETIKDDNDKEVIVTKYQQFDPRGSLKVIDFEVVDWDNMNFMVQEMRTSFERRQKKSAWIKEIAVPAMMVAATLLLCIIMIKFGFDYSKGLQTTPMPRAATEATTPDVPLVGNVLPGS